MLLPLSLALAAPPVTAPIPTDRYPDLTTREVVTVLILGDSGVAAGFGPVAQAAAEVCFGSTRAAPCDLALLVGDNVYEDGITAPGEQAWIDAFATPMAPFVARAKGPERFRAWVVAGNHDWGHHANAAGEVRVQAAMDTTTHPANDAIGALWQYPALAYTVPGLPAWLGLHGLDTELVVAGKGGAVVRATRKAMEATTGWDVVFGHHLPASTGGHGSEGELDDEVYARVLQRLRPAGLSLVLAGHDHHQELLETGGIPVVVQGNSSKGRDVMATKYTPCSKWARGGKQARGFAIATFRADAVTLEYFDGAGASVAPPVELRRDAIPAGREAGKRSPRIGSCPT